MAYEIYFSKFRSGELEEFPSEIARNILIRFGVEEFGTLVYAELPDGLSVDCLTDSLNEDTTSGFGIEFRGVSGSLFELVYAICTGCKMVAIVTDTPYLPIVCDESLAVDIPASITSEHAPVFCNSKEDVANALCPGFDRWAEWASRRPSLDRLSSDDHD